MKTVRLVFALAFAAKLFAGPVGVTVDSATKAFVYPSAAQLRAANDLLAASTAATLYQPLSANLTDLAGQASTAYGRATLNLSDAIAARVYFGVRIGQDVQAWSPNLDAWSLLAPSTKADTSAFDAHVARTDNPHAVTKAQVGLGAVTNDAQTKAAVVPNTAPAAGQLLVGSAGGTAYAPTSVSGDATLASTGALTLATVNATPATYGDASHSLTVAVDAKGRATSVASQPISIAPAQINAAIPNASLANASVTIGSTTIALGATTATLTGISDPVNATDVVNKRTLDAYVYGLDWKSSVRVATTGNITLSGPQTIDGVAVVAGDRVLVRAQTDTTANGLYAVATGAWSRTADGAQGQLTTGATAFVSEGTLYGKCAFALITGDPITVGATPLSFSQVTGPNLYTAGTGINIAGNAISAVNVPNSALANSAVTIAGTSTALGGSITLDQITGLAGTGLIKRTGANALAIATSGTDYAPATSGAALLYGNGSGGFSNATVGSGLSFSAGALSANVTSVAGRTGAVTLTKTDVGLSNVDNTSDAAKPISTATQTALNAKTDTTTFNSAINARAPAQGLVFDGSAGATGTLGAVLSGYSTLTATVDVPAMNPTGGLGILVCGPSYGSTLNLCMYISGLGALRVEKFGASTSDLRAATVSGLVTSYGGRRVAIAAVINGTTLTLYIDGTSVAFAETTVGSTPPAWGDTLGSGNVYVGKLGAASNYYVGYIGGVGVFNRALSADEISALSSGIPAASDRNNASNTAFYSSDFSAGLDSWFAAVGCAAAGNVDGISGRNDVLRATSDAGSSQHRIERTGLSLVTGKRYRITADIYIPSTNATIKKVFIQTPSGTSASRVASTLDAWTSLVLDFSPGDGEADTTLRIRGANATNAVDFVGTAGDVFYVSNVKVYPIGLLAAFDPQALGQGTSWQPCPGVLCGPLTWTTGISWALPWSGVINGGFKGTTTNDSAATGYVGEYVSSTVANTAVALASATATNITSISLTAGDWDVSGLVDYLGTGATFVHFTQGPSSTSATLGSTGSFSKVSDTSTGVSDNRAHVTPIVRFSLPATTTVYLVGRANFSAGTVTAGGTIRARRIR